MPNWCNNVVMIKGNQHTIKIIKDTLQESGNVFSFNKVLECPPALLNGSSPNRNEQSAAFNTKRYGASDWYNWCISNWGTKWNSSSAHLTQDDEEELSYTFETAWSPPIPVYKKLAEMFPNTNIFINYDESGCDFSGYQYYEKGELSKSVEYDSSYYAVRTFMEPDNGVWEWLE